MFANPVVYFSTGSASLFLTSEVQSAPKLPTVTVYLPRRLYRLWVGGAQKKKKKKETILNEPLAYHQRIKTNEETEFN